jgi:orotate phosphoribosyltransferase
VNYPKKELFELIKKLSFHTGNFTLASGKHANYYIDCRMTTLSGRGAYLIGQLFYDMIAPLNVDAVGGMVIGADPMVASIIARSAEVGSPLNGFLVRKEAKGHGTGRQIEGHLEPWMRIVLVEDVVTTGGSLVKAVQAIQKTYPNIRIEKILSIVDRNEGGKETFEKLTIPYQSLYSVNEFLQG